MGIGRTISKVKRVGTVLGVDASTNSFAFCLYDENGPSKWGEVQFKGNSVFERLSDGQRKLTAIADELKADLIVFESAVFVQNKKTVILLAYAFGMVVAALMTMGARVEEVSPIAWQHFINNKPLTKAEKERVIRDNPGKSKAWYSNHNREIRKQRTIQWVADSFGIKVDSDNVSDAIAVAHYGWETFGKD